MHLDEYVIDTLMADLVGHDRQPSAFFVYVLLWRRTLKTPWQKRYDTVPSPR